MDRFYAWLGFGPAKCIPTFGFKGAQYGGSNMVLPLTWPDRLRVLLSGKIAVDIVHMMDAPPKSWHSETAFSVLPPNYRGEGAKE